AGVPCKVFVNLIWTNYTTQSELFVVAMNTSCCITRLELNGLRMGLSETKNMAQLTWANTLGSVGECLSFPTRAEDDINTAVAGTMTGMLYKSTGQKLKPSIIKVITGTQGVTITWLYILYIQNNMDTPSN
uniref:Uncharacterized protein n=1 Tax=Oncorhynchus mykiss TaxID=8022 RepID=A0A8C7SSF1_ONCMY